MSQAHGNVFEVNADNNDSTHRLLEDFIALGDAFMRKALRFVVLKRWSA